MKPIWKASTHVKGPNDSDIYEAGIDIIAEVDCYWSQSKRTDTHHFAVAFYDVSKQGAIDKRNYVLNLVWADGAVDMPEVLK